MRLFARAQRNATRASPAVHRRPQVRLALPDVACFGFSPIRHTPNLLHAHDEFVPVASFLEGIRCYVAMLPVLLGGGFSGGGAATA